MLSATNGMHFTGFPVFGDANNDLLPVTNFSARDDSAGHTVEFIDEDDDLASEGAATSVAGRGVKRRTAPYSACDRCRRRKVRCDGALPCSFCTGKDGICTYTTTQPPVKKPKLVASNTIVRSADPHFSFESTLVNSFTRLYYSDLYNRHVFRTFPMLGSATITTQTLPDTLEYNMSMCHAARALGHKSVATELFAECRGLASQLIDSFTPGTAAGFFLMGFYMWGVDDNLAYHYFQIANSIAQQTSSNSKSQRIMQMMEKSKMLSGPDRPFTGERLTEVIPFPVAPLQRDMIMDYAQVLSHPILEEILDFARTFPKQDCVFNDIFCELCCLARRFPEEQRSNEFLPFARADILLRCARPNQEAVAVATRISVIQDAPTQEMRQFMVCVHAALSGVRLQICSYAGWVEMGCRFARETVETIEKFSGFLAGFSHHHFAMAACMLSSFVILYKRNPYGAHLDYRAFLIRITDALRPLAHLTQIAPLIVGLEKAIHDPHPAPAAAALPNNAEICREWMAEPIPDFEAIWHLIREGTENPEKDAHLRRAVVQERPLVIAQMAAMDAAAAVPAVDPTDFDDADQFGNVFHLGNAGEANGTIVSEALPTPTATSDLGASDNIFGLLSPELSTRASQPLPDAMAFVDALLDRKPFQRPATNNNEMPSPLQRLLASPTVEAVSLTRADDGQEYDEII